MSATKLQADPFIRQTRRALYTLLVAIAEKHGREVAYTIAAGLAERFAPQPVNPAKITANVGELRIV